MQNFLCPGAVQPAPGPIRTVGLVRPGGYLAQAVWLDYGSTLTYTVPSWATQYRDLAGNLVTGIGSTVTIGLDPILLENHTGF